MADPQGKSTIKPGVLMTLERPKGKERAVVVCPSSYLEAQIFARKAFNLSPHAQISLRRSLKKVEGSGYNWGHIIPEQWANVVRANVDEVGEFLEEYRPLWDLMTHSRTEPLDIEFNQADGADRDNIPLKENSGAENRELLFTIDNRKFEEAHGVGHSIPLPSTYQNCQLAIRQNLVFSYSRAPSFLLPTQGIINDVGNRFRISGRYTDPGTPGVCYSVLNESSYETFITSHLEKDNIPVIKVAWPI